MRPSARLTVPADAGRLRQRAAWFPAARTRLIMREGGQELPGSTRPVLQPPVPLPPPARQSGLRFRDRRPGPPPELIAPWRRDGAQFPDPVAGFLVMRRQHLPRPLRHLDVGRDAQVHRSLGLAQLGRLGWSAPCQRAAGRQISGLDVAAPSPPVDVCHPPGPARKASTWRPWTLRMGIRGPAPLGPED